MRYSKSEDMPCVQACLSKSWVLCACVSTVLAIALTSNVPAMAAGPDAAAQAEIAHLLTYLGQSGCEFYRNGTWHSARDASEHLASKYDYLLKKGWVRTAEDFIARAGAASSTSGKPYQVRCAGTPPVPSAGWLRDELRRYRSQP